jgi:hypothetical protein
LYLSIFELLWTEGPSRGYDKKMEFILAIVFFLVLVYIYANRQGIEKNTTDIIELEIKIDELTKDCSTYQKMIKSLEERKIEKDS